MRIRCVVPATDAPPTLGLCLRAIREAAQKQEQAVSQQIDSLYELAFKEKVFAAMAELQWFVTEQVEEEKTIREIVSKLRMVQGDSSAVLDLDRELGSRAAEPAPPSSSRP